MNWITVILASVTASAGIFTGIIVCMASVIHGVLTTLSATEYTRVMQAIITQGRKSPVILFLILFPMLAAIPVLIFFYAQAETSLFMLTFSGFLAWVGGPFLLSRWLSEPLYNMIMQWQTPPADWQNYRQRWFRINLLRAASGLLAFMLFGTAIHLSLL